MLYPEEENVFAYNLDDAGISSSESDDALDDDEKGERKVNIMIFYKVSATVNYNIHLYKGKKCLNS
jgi:hypothetical protein